MKANNTYSLIFPIRAGTASLHAIAQAAKKIAREIKAQKRTTKNVSKIAK